MIMERIRNFCIIAHIDHGKSTLADRLLEMTNTVDKEKLHEQFLDQMDLERERGITIKSHPVRMEYRGYILNLIDTPGHVDFSYEVSRALRSCEGAILLVDVTQGVQAQTLANYLQAINLNLKIIPVFNKVDLQNYNEEFLRKQVEDILFIPFEDFEKISAKTGYNVDKVLDRIIKEIPSPQGNLNSPFRALIFDAVYSSYKGVIVYIRVFDGKIKKGDKIRFYSTGRVFEVEEVGVFKPFYKEVDMLSAGEVGYFCASIKDLNETRIGDTVCSADSNVEPISGFKEPKQMVFCSFYPADGDDYSRLEDAILKLKLNDSALFFEKEKSNALGYGFKCGFLGLLHMQIVQERLERHFGISVISTTPTVKYKIVYDSQEVEIDSPSLWPDNKKIEKVLEPYIKGKIIIPHEFLSEIIKLVQDRRGEVTHIEKVGNLLIIEIEAPLSEIIVDFFDKLKSYTKGFASFDYEFLEYRESDLVKVDILVHNVKIDALSFIIHRQKAYYASRKIVQKLRETIGKQLFEYKIQAAIGARVIASESVKPLRKDVLAKCYGGDVTRKRKLLEKQKEGKKRMKTIGKVSIPQEAFWQVLSINNEE
ncbi:MAG: translation elongation factor 4 [Candidatus Calescibacterium sp.]|nr:translation elongation factor 4 [Candidatus Calescibacterium sp.]MCX7972089.1 translation elongation factor 4 [bacterium]MDW8194626.1 translation elongation factor 4 [Candidatus Calescibacterium sp.]